MQFSFKKSSSIEIVNNIRKFFLKRRTQTELDLDEDNSPGLSVCVKILTQIWKPRKLFPGAVVASSGVVVTGEEKMEGTLFMVMDFQKLVRGCQDLAEKMVVGKFKIIFELK
ncbi:hypothetical protein MTR_4g039945 [Medicago truncatula]|uniref:Uncharacterized protein n=1 Tax=Medicago truncatula TaxID=3880 RepID=A0A072UUG9_MEDTR|nr:hypothetical protein MTR_4g039945 [Medicago truncatula]